MAFLLRRWRPHVRRGLLPIIMLPDRDFLFGLHLCAVFEFWLSEGVFTLRKRWWGGVSYFVWKPPLTNPWHFTSQRSTSHATQGFITPGEPQLFCPRMVQLLAGIISLRRTQEANPGCSHGNSDRLPLRHSVQQWLCWLVIRDGNSTTVYNYFK